MKVLVIGKGGREHALVWRLNQSPSVRKLYCAPGNPGTAQHAESIAIQVGDFPALIDFARSNSIDLTVVGPDDPLGDGIVDEFQRNGLRIFGPTKSAARIETSKSFAKSIMTGANVPTARYSTFDDADAARRYVREHGAPIVVKADGLTLGKGVTVCADAETALAAIGDAMESGKFGSSGRRVVLEERLTGEEITFFALCDGEHAIPFGTFQDHKPIFDDDRGPNTGGMGAYSPVPQFRPALEARVMSEVVTPAIRAMASNGTPFRGLLYAGLMVDGDSINVIEFNARFGDPECQALMMRFESDLAEALLASCEGRVGELNLRISAKSAVTVVLASAGYPGDYRKGLPITGIDKLEGGGVPSDLKVKWSLGKIRVKVFHAGTAMRDGQLVTDGGRVLNVTALAPDLKTAIDTAYQVAAMIEFDGKYMRRDIGRRALARLAT